MRLIAAAALLSLLAACGVDGAPQAPGAGPAAGATVTGEISMGVTGSL